MPGWCNVSRFSTLAATGRMRPEGVFHSPRRTTPNEPSPNFPVRPQQYYRPLFSTQKDGMLANIGARLYGTHIVNFLLVQIGTSCYYPLIRSVRLYG